MYKIVISPFSAKAKVYPYWQDLINELKEDGHYIIQLGIKGNNRFNNTDEFVVDAEHKVIKKIIEKTDFFISIDNFLPHFVNFFFPNKKNFVIFGLSDPKIFGYLQNVNILKSRSYLRKNQFLFWFIERVNKECWLESNKVKEIIYKELKNG